MADRVLFTPRSVASLPVHTQVEWDASNSLLLSLPVELTSEILDYFPKIGPHTTVHALNPIVPKSYLVRIDVLRALSQVCIHYRRVFLPLLWESLNICFALRGDTSKSTKFYGDTIVRKCDGLSANPNLASYIG
jgi:hypothetical protein